MRESCTSGSVGGPGGFSPGATLRALSVRAMQTLLALADAPAGRCPTLTTHERTLDAEAVVVGWP